MNECLHLKMNGELHRYADYILADFTESTIHIMNTNMTLSLQQFL